MKKLIADKTYDEERALYNLCDAEVLRCSFSGPADGESALKEARSVKVRECDFHLRYPLWHTEDFELCNCTMDATVRAPLWYSKRGIVDNCRIESVKCLRECSDVVFRNTNAVSPEFGWRCKGLVFENSHVESEYLFFETKNAKFYDFSMKGKYSFQYVEDMVFENCTLDTKDAFWHAKNVVCKNCTVKGEYLGWYSENLSFINCKISGTQPFCYCENLKIVNCTMEDTDLAFEYSSVDAEIIGDVLSVKNPHKGRIVADSFGEIIKEGSIFDIECEITVRQSENRR